MFEDKSNCYQKVKRCCVDIVIYVLSVLFTFVIGIIIGAETGIFVSLGVGAFVTLAIILGVLTAIRTIMLLCFETKCDKKNRDKKYECCE